MAPRRRQVARWRSCSLPGELTLALRAIPFEPRAAGRSPGLFILSCPVENRFDNRITKGRFKSEVQQRSIDGIEQ
jgi:hypothetical protein